MGSEDPKGAHVSAGNVFRERRGGESGPVVCARCRNGHVPCAALLADWSKTRPGRHLHRQSPRVSRRHFFKRQGSILALAGNAAPVLVRSTSASSIPAQGRLSLTESTAARAS